MACPGGLIPISDNMPILVPLTSIRTAASCSLMCTEIPAYDVDNVPNDDTIVTNISMPPTKNPDLLTGKKPKSRKTEVDPVNIVRDYGVYLVQFSSYTVSNVQGLTERHSTRTINVPTVSYVTYAFLESAMASVDTLSPTHVGQRECSSFIASCNLQENETVTDDLSDVQPFVVGRSVEARIQQKALGRPQHWIRELLRLAGPRLADITDGTLWKDIWRPDGLDTAAIHPLSDIFPSTTPSILISGDHGTGRSTLAKILAYEAAHYNERTVFYLEGAVLAQETVHFDKSLDTIATTVEKALRHSPAVIVIDDLDILCPNHESLAEFTAAENTEGLHDGNVISAFLVNTFANTGQAATLRYQPPSPNSHDVGSLCTACTFVGITRSISSLHPALRIPELFYLTLRTGTLCHEQRRSIIERHSFLRLDQWKFPKTLVIFLRPKGISNSWAEALHNASLRQILEAVDCILLDALVRMKHETDYSTFESCILNSVPVVNRLNHDEQQAQFSTEQFPVGGLFQVKKALHDMLCLPQRYSELVARTRQLSLPKGALVIGPPGCGKTSVVLEVCLKSRLPMHVVRGPELLSKYVGGSEAAIRSVFEKAHRAAPSVVFFDEVEALAPRRGTDSTGVTDRVVNQILCYLDGIESRANVFVIAASSRPDLIDPSLLRPGRFDKILYCGLPNGSEVKDILICQLRDDCSSFVDEICGSLPPYVTGADIQDVLTTARMEAEKDRSSTCPSLVYQRSHFVKAVNDMTPSLSLACIRAYHNIYKMYLPGTDIAAICRCEERISDYIKHQKPKPNTSRLPFQLQEATLRVALI